MRTNNLSKRRVKRIVNCFASGLTAIDTSYKLKLHRNTINKYYRQIREAIANHESKLVHNISFNEQVETYRLLWHKNQGLCLSTELSNEADLLIFYMVLVDDKVYVINPDNKLSHSNLFSLPPNAAGNKDQVSQNSGTDAEILRTFPPLATRFFHYSKEKLIKFYGVKPQYTYLYLQELEFRFNHHDTNISNLIIKLLTDQEKDGSTSSFEEEESVSFDS